MKWLLSHCDLPLYVGAFPLTQEVRVTHVEMLDNRQHNASTLNLNTPDSHLASSLNMENSEEINESISLTLTDTQWRR